MNDIDLSPHVTLSGIRPSITNKTIDYQKLLKIVPKGGIGGQSAGCDSVSLNLNMAHKTSFLGATQGLSPSQRTTIFLVSTRLRLFLMWQ